MNEEPREPLNNPIRRNVFVDCTKQVCDFDGNVRKLLDKFEMADNLVVNTPRGTDGAAAAKEIKGWTDLRRHRMSRSRSASRMRRADFTLRKARGC